MKVVKYWSLEDYFMCKTCCVTAFTLSNKVNELVPEPLKVTWMEDRVGIAACASKSVENAFNRALLAHLLMNNRCGFSECIINV